MEGKGGQDWRAVGRLKMQRCAGRCLLETGLAVPIALKALAALKGRFKPARTAFDTQLCVADDDATCQHQIRCAQLEFRFKPAGWC